MTAARRGKLLLGLGIALLAALTLISARASRRTAPPSPVPRIDNPGPQGLEAAYLYLAGRGQARALEGPYTALPADARVLVAALPFARPVEDEERRALLAWVDAGGTLLVLAHHERELGGLLNGVIDPVFVALHLKDREVGLADIGRDVKALLDSASRPDGLEVLPARKVMGDPLLAGVRTLAVGTGRGFEAHPGPAVPLLVAGDTPVALALAHGKGRILLLAGADALANARVDLADNPQLLANLGAAGPVLFDEHHHAEAPAVAVQALARNLGLPALAAVLVALALALASLRRLGPLAPALGPAPRSARDYAVQLGRLYARARAEPTLAADLLQGLRGRARLRAHLPPGADDREVSERLARASPDRARQYGALCAELEQAARRPGSPRGYLDLARRTARLEGEL